jgi:dTDP-4-dehydrorhamnose reductase
MRLLVTGAGGMLGQRVVAEARDLGHSASGTDLQDLDLTDEAAVRDRVAAEEPDAIINCAAYTDVDGAESHEELAMRVNGDAAGNVARACASAGALLVHVSTDYVFSGDGDRPYVESDEPGPRTAYGRSKLAGERAVIGSDAVWAIVRSAWLYGAGGKNFVDTMLGLAQDRDEVSVVTDQVGSPTWTGQLAPALVEVAERRATGLHHLTGEGQCSWYELAVEVFHEADVSCRVLPTTSEAFERPARRPAYSALATERDDAIVLGPWQQGLAGYLAERVPA